MSGPPDIYDRIAQLLVAVAMVFALANGLFMLIAPLDWYYAVPTISATGPANTHFIADIGIAYHRLRRDPALCAVQNITDALARRAGRGLSG